jgi:hypothetical protein
MTAAGFARRRPGRAPIAFALGALALLASAADAAISGRAIRADNGQPVAGLTVGVQAEPGSPTTTTDANGQFTLNVNPAEPIYLAAWKPYDHAPSAVNYATAAEFAIPGQTDVEFRMSVLPTVDQAGYSVPSVGSCGTCHADQFAQWQQSVHANAARNVWVRDLFSGDGTPGGGAGYVFTQTHDPGETGFCATCHAPMQDVFTPGQVMFNAITGPAGLDGVSCLGCHQIADVDPAQLNGLHHVGGKSDYRFPAATEHPTEFWVWGPLRDVEAGTMRNLYSPLYRQALYCASCHQYNNPDTGAPGQTTYTEWLASPFAQPGPNQKVCQDCHMPPADGPGTIATTSPVIRPAEQRRGHQFGGSTPANLQQAILLRATASQVGGQVEVQVEVENRGAGHAFPTGVSIRNAFVLVEARIGTSDLVQTAGPTLPFWLNDAVPGIQPGDYAGRPGKGFAKILEGRINGQGPIVRPVLFIDAEGVHSDTAIPSGATDVSTYRFQIPAGVVGQATITTRLVYRRAFRELYVTKGWTERPTGGPIETEIARVVQPLAVSGVAPVAIPATNVPSLVALLLGLLLIGAFAWRVGRP